MGYPNPSFCLCTVLGSYKCHLVTPLKHSVCIASLLYRFICLRVGAVSSARPSDHRQKCVEDPRHPFAEGPTDVALQYLLRSDEYWLDQR